MDNNLKSQLDGQIQNENEVPIRAPVPEKPSDKFLFDEGIEMNKDSLYLFSDEMVIDKKIVQDIDRLRKTDSYNLDKAMGLDKLKEERRIIHAHHIASPQYNNRIHPMDLARSQLEKSSNMD